MSTACSSFIQDISQIGKKVRHEMVRKCFMTYHLLTGLIGFAIYCVCVGVLCVAGTDHRLSEVHARLMAQNISLHSLLESRPLKQQSHKIPHH